MPEIEVIKHEIGLVEVSIGDEPMTEILMTRIDLIESVAQGPAGRPGDVGPIGPVGPPGQIPTIDVIDGGNF